jgi:hypothetical protein
MPRQKEFFAGVQSHAIFKRSLEGEQGDARSLQHFFLVSYGVYDWLSIDLKGGVGNIGLHSSTAEDIDYPTRLGGGYGFRVKLYDKETMRIVGGFQHISIHPSVVSSSGKKNKAVLDDWQFSLLASHDVGKITPYAGIKWSRCDYIHWADGDRKRVQSDLTKSIGLVLGCDVPLGKQVWLNLEGQGIAAIAASVSVNVSF